MQNRVRVIRVYAHTHKGFMTTSSHIIYGQIIPIQPKKSVCFQKIHYVQLSGKIKGISVKSDISDRNLRGHSIVFIPI